MIFNNLFLPLETIKGVPKGLNRQQLQQVQPISQTDHRKLDMSKIV